MSKDCLACSHRFDGICHNHTSGIPCNSWECRELSLYEDRLRKILIALNDEDIEGAKYPITEYFETVGIAKEDIL